LAPALRDSRYNAVATTLGASTYNAPRTRRHITPTTDRRRILEPRRAEVALLRQPHTLGQRHRSVRHHPTTPRRTRCRSDRRPTDRRRAAARARRPRRGKNCWPPSWTTSRPRPSSFSIKSTKRVGRQRALHVLEHLRRGHPVAGRVLAHEVALGRDRTGAVGMVVQEPYGLELRRQRHLQSGVQSLRRAARRSRPAGAPTVRRAASTSSKVTRTREPPRPSPQEHELGELRRPSVESAEKLTVSKSSSFWLRRHLERADRPRSMQHAVGVLARVDLASRARWRDRMRTLEIAAEQSQLRFPDLHLDPAQAAAPRSRRRDRSPCSRRAARCGPRRARARRRASNRAC
jgi:hypothetical protein